MVRRGRGRIELILLNVTLRAIAPGSPPPTPFVPAGNKRRFHPRDVVKLLSLPRVFPTPSPSLPSFISDTSVIHGIRKNDLRSSRISPPPSSSSSPSCRCEYVHTCPVRVYVYAYIRVHDGGRRSEWVATVEARVIREFIGACYAYYSSAWGRGELSVARDVSYY